jgi:hypothetical protein
MNQINEQDRVRLSLDLPELGLSAGQVGRVISTWFYPHTAFEVEFEPEPGACARRVLLLKHQVARADEATTAERPNTGEVYRASPNA